MFEYQTRTWLDGELVEVIVKYQINDGVIEIEKANVIGVCHRGSFDKRFEYTPIDIEVILRGRDMPSIMYDDFVFRAEQDLDQRHYDCEAAA
jgi:hypothetical protein